jgi:hypothetical protein
LAEHYKNVHSREGQTIDPTPNPGTLSSTGDFRHQEPWATPGPVEQQPPGQHLIWGSGQPGSDPNNFSGPHQNVVTTVVGTAPQGARTPLDTSDNIIVIDINNMDSHSKKTNVDTSNNINVVDNDTMGSISNKSKVDTSDNIIDINIDNMDSHSKENNVDTSNNTIIIDNINMDSHNKKTNVDTSSNNIYSHSNEMDSSNIKLVLMS